MGRDEMTDDTTTEAPPPPEATKQLTPAKAFRRDVDAMKPELEKALRGKIPADYFTRVLSTTVQRNPKLLECDRLSLLGAIMEGAQLGLVPDGATGYGYLVPYWNPKARTYFAQFQPGYRGFVQLAYRGGAIVKVVAREVCAGDEFAYQYGTDEWIKHVPAIKDRGEITHFYAVASQKVGPPIFVVLPREDVDLIRDRAKVKNRGKDSPAWGGNYPAMGRKTAVRALFRWLPLESEAHRAAAEDEAFDADDNPLPRDVEAEVVEAAGRSAMDSLLDEEVDAPAPAGPEAEAELVFVKCPACIGGANPPESGNCEKCGGAGEVPQPITEAETSTS